MSASLVGSEMCIRDSSSAEGCAGAAAARPAAGVAGGETTAAQQEKQPVSYTHLTLPTICSV
eukprot:14690520-Alexandrium_andersonii.AAC.1